MAEATSRAADVQSGIRIEMLTIGWMVVEAVVSVGSGVLAHSTLLIAFGLDSVIELISAALLLWRLQIEARGSDVERVEQVEQRAAWVAGILLVLLCVYVLVTAVYGLLSGAHSEDSIAGIVVAAIAVVAMPWLGVSKRRIAERIQSSALRADAAESLTCAYMAGTVVVGLVLNTLFHWWWAEDIAALAFLFWLVQETRETLEEARGGDHNEHDEHGH